MAQTSLMLHWRWAYLTIKGKIRINPDAAAERDVLDADKIALIHDFVPFLFINCKLSIGNRLVEDVSHPGYVSTVLFTLPHDRNHPKSSGLDYFFVPNGANVADSTTIKGRETCRVWLTKATTKGEFTVKFPLYMIFGAFDILRAFRLHGGTGICLRR